MKRLWWMLLAIGLCGVALPIWAQILRIPVAQPTLGQVYLDTDSTVRNHLQRADAALASEQWAEGIDILQNLIQNSGEKLAKLSAGRYVNVRTLCHLKLADLGPEALDVYRQRVDAQARLWYEQGARKRQATLLEKVVREAFCSSSGDDALWLLGELALEQGDVAQARAWWEKLVPASTAHDSLPRDLTYPDSGLDPASVQARLVLCRILQDDGSAAQREWKQFAQRYPESQGYLAGRDGRYVGTLADLLEARQQWPDSRPEQPWTTFAGNVQRNYVLPRPVEVGGIEWSISLKRVSASQRSPRLVGRPLSRVSEDADRILGYYPVLVNEKLLIHHAGQIEVYDLATGKPAWPADGPSRRGVVYPPDLQRSRQAHPQQFAWYGAPRYTLSVHGNRIYARMGSPVTSRMAHWPRANLFGMRARSSEDSLVCLDMERQGSEVWTIQAPDQDMAFEGSPVVDEGRVYVAVRRGGTNPQAHVACYDADTGDLQWIRFVCQASTLAAGQQEVTHNLLTLGSGRIYYCTNLGAVAALDARDGTVEWVFTYERHSPRPRLDHSPHFQRDLNPCIYHQGTVIAAPSDTPMLFALEADTGLPRWQTEMLADTVHLLGVAQGHLFAGGQRLYAVDLITGKLRWYWPDSKDPSARGYGRGLLAADRVYWPMREEIRVFDQTTGQTVERIPLREVYGQTGGHLLASDGYLVIVQPERLVVFSEIGRRLEQYQQDLAQHPQEASRHWWVARAAEANRQWDLAVARYRSAMELAGPGDHIGAAPLAEKSRERLYQLLWRRAQSYAQAGQFEQAVNDYHESKAVASTDTQRLAALWKEAQTWESADRSEDAIAAYQAILAEPVLAQTPWEVANQLARPAWREVAWCVDRLIQQHGRGIYASWDQKADEELRIAEQAGDFIGVEAILDRYPNAVIAPEAWRRLAQHYAEQNQPIDAVRAYRKLFEFNSNLELERTSREALAALYDDLELEGLAEASRRLAERAVAAHLAGGPGTGVGQQQYGKVPKLQPSGGESPGAFLTADPYPALTSAAAVHLPLRRAWERPLPEGARVLEPAGISPGTELLWGFVTVPDGLECWSVKEGRPLWRRPSSQPVQWIGYAGDNLLISTQSSVSSVSLWDGSLNWQRRLTAEPATMPASRDASANTFLLHQNRLICLDALGLVALEVFSGEVLWTDVRRGELSLIAVFDDGTLLVHRPEQGEIVLLDVATGQPHDQLNVGRGSWARPPSVFASQLCVVPNRQRVEMYDLRTHNRQWQWEEPLSLGGTAPDVLYHSADTVLVLIGGDQLFSLNPQTGQAYWSRTLDIKLMAGDSHPRHLGTVDWEAFYFVAGGLLTAIRLTDGQELWQQHVGTPSGVWRVRRAGAYLICYPVSGSSFASSPGSLAASKDQREVPRWPLVFCDPQDGALVQRCEFEGVPRDVVVMLGVETGAVADRRRIRGLLSLESPPGGMRSEGRF